MSYKAYWNKNTAETIVASESTWEEGKYRIPEDAIDVIPPLFNPRLEFCRWDYDGNKWEVTKLSAIVQLREERTRRLIKTDFWALSDRKMSENQIRYRQELRDLPAKFTDSSPLLDEFGELTNINWPKLEQEG